MQEPKPFTGPQAVANTALEEAYYELTEGVINAAASIIDSNPENPQEQVNQMMYLTQNIMASLLETLSGASEETAVALAKNAHKIVLLRKQALERKVPN